MVATFREDAAVWEDAAVLKDVVGCEGASVCSATIWDCAVCVGVTVGMDTAVWKIGEACGSAAIWAAVVYEVREGAVWDVV
mmetsp:Transcript_56668/g.93691  ORF Transcript_56668/g.93691 Transcript_56668/m.93691 type:complete len:81 (-) Transcript_56668:660-902(-)